MNSLKITAIIPSAGKGERAGFSENKLLQKINGETVIHKTVKIFDDFRQVDEIIVVCSTTDKQVFEGILNDIKKPLKLVIGGETRFDSVYNALKIIDDGAVIIHDGARPFLDTETLEKCVTSLIRYGSAVVCTPLTDTVCETDGKENIISSNRKNKYAVQTPQCFTVSELKRAYELSKDCKDFTDDAGVYTSYIGKCKMVLGKRENLKLTYKEDFETSVKDNLRVGVGFDLHKLTENRKLILGGIEIPHSKGLLGHSDADVLTHAIMDALLSSVNLRDIGYHFPDTDEQYKGISSMKLLEKVLLLLKEKGYAPSQVSAVVMAEKPKMSSYVESISQNIANALKIGRENVGITLTTLEGIGIVGREEGIAVQAYVTVEKIKEQNEKNKQ